MRRAAALGLVLAWISGAGCASSSRVTLDPEMARQLEQMQRAAADGSAGPGGREPGATSGSATPEAGAAKGSVVREPGEAKGSVAPEPGATEGSGGTSPSREARAAPPAVAPPSGRSGAGAGGSAVATPAGNPATRLARARTALPPGTADSPLRAVDDASPYVVGLLSAGSSGRTDRATVVLVDAGREPAVLVGRHDFEARVSELAGALDLRSDDGDTLVLAELAGPGGTTACGWLLAERRPRFLCAPKLSAPSRYDAVQGELVESWEATFPPPDLAPRARTGRVMRYSAAAGWSEVDGFRCLAHPLEESVVGSRPGDLRRWQHDSVGRLAKAARRADEGLRGAEAERLLREAIAADACDAEPWRLLGRLEFESGRPAEAAPSLAVAVALASYEAAPLVDLADALVDLENSRPADRAAFEKSREVLSRPPSIRPLAERAQDARGLARSLYELYLERTAEAAPLHQARRRRVETQLRSM